MDGRNERVMRSKAAIMAATRDAMKAGDFQLPLGAPVRIVQAIVLGRLP